MATVFTDIEWVLLIDYTKKESTVTTFYKETTSWKLPYIPYTAA